MSDLFTVEEIKTAIEVAQKNRMPLLFYKEVHGVIKLIKLLDEGKFPEANDFLNDLDIITDELYRPYANAAFEYLEESEKGKARINLIVRAKRFLQRT